MLRIKVRLSITFREKNLKSNESELLLILIFYIRSKA